MCYKGLSFNRNTVTIFIPNYAAHTAYLINLLQRLRMGVVVGA